MWDIINTKLYGMLADSHYRSHSNPDIDLRKAYIVFVEKLFMYLDAENDSIKRIRALSITPVEFEMIKSLELSFGGKKNILKITYSDTLLLLTSKEQELILSGLFESMRKTNSI